MSVLPYEIEKRKSKTKGPRFRVRFRLPATGKKRYDSHYVGSLAAAQSIAARIEIEIAAGRDPRDILKSVGSDAPGTPTMDDLFEAIIVRQKSDSATKSYTNTRKRMGDLGAAQCGDITPKQVQEWLDANSDLALESIRKYKGNAAKVWDSAMIEGYNPFSDRRLNVHSKKVEDEETVDPPSYEEFQAMLVELDRKHAMFGLVARFQEATGLRRAEIGDLRRTNIDWRSWSLTVVKTKRNTGGIRQVPLNDEIMPLLMDFVPFEDRTLDRPLFPGYHPHTYNNHITSAFGRAGIRNLTSHQLRHRCISVWLLALNDTLKVSKMAGHKKSSLTTDTYGHVMLREVADRIEMIRKSVLRLDYPEIFDPETGALNPAQPPNQPQQNMESADYQGKEW